MKRTVTVTTCPLCERPLTLDDSAAGPYSQILQRREALLVEIGFSRGGWGYRDFGDGVSVKFSGEICGECFDAAQEVLRPVAEFIRNRQRREEHHVPPVRDNVMAPEGRGKSLLRSLSYISGNRGARE